jgi:hypothetical protein
MRSVTRRSSTGLTENAGLLRIAGVTNGSPSKTISKIFGAQPVLEPAVDRDPFQV